MGDNFRVYDHPRNSSQFSFEHKEFQGLFSSRNTETGRRDPLFDTFMIPAI